MAASVRVSTDGSCLSQQAEGSGPIGWAWAKHEVTSSEKPMFKAGGAAIGTNQIAELTATLMALRQFAPGMPMPAKHLIIETDSQYTINSSTTWLPGWKRNGWKNSKKQVVSNLELIKAIDAEITKRRDFGGTLEFVWVKGHSGNKYNELVDDLARDKATSFLGTSANSNTDLSQMPPEACAIITKRWLDTEPDTTLFLV